MRGRAAADRIYIPLVEAPRAPPEIESPRLNLS